MALKKYEFKKDANINVPMTAADKARLLKMAQARGITTAQFIRGVLFEREHELKAA
jgi:hypothetical protein